MQGNDMRRTLAKLGIPVEGLSVLGVWPTGQHGGVAIQLNSSTFWWVVRRTRVPVRTTERDDWLLPYRHQFTLDGVECFTFSAEPVLLPGTLTPGYALRLT